MANATPDSRTPRRFSAITNRIAHTQNSTLWLATNGTADPMFDMADAVETATVRT
jgi:hypothetical protein